MAADNDTASCAAADVTGRRPSLVGSGPTGQRGRGTAMRWFFSAIWLVYLIGPVAALFKGHHGVLWIAGGVVLAVVFCAVYIFVLGTWVRHPRRANIGLAVIAALAVVACLVYGQDWTAMWIYVSAATGFVFPGRRRALLAVAACGGCYALLSWISHVPVSTFVLELLPVVLVGWAMVGFRLQLVLMYELRQARETVAKLAANEERLRLARDMHDLTGLTERSGEVSLEVSDNGRGLTAVAGPAGPDLPSGTGLHGMSERLSAVGGRFSVGSTGRDGRGFRLIATVPAAPEPKPAPAAPPVTEAPVDANVPS